MALPLPDPNELQDYPLSYQAKAIYSLLHQHQGEPLTMQQIRERLGELGQQEQLDRRRRELNRYFLIERVGQSRDTGYVLVAAKPRSAEAEPGISERDRAAVLMHGRCAFCGRTPLEHGVVLQVDHKIPQDWGGTSALENLQPLCEECNRGKKAHFATYDDHAEEIRAVIGFDSVHRRIGEFLKLAEAPVRSDVLAMVASPPGDYQEDWQKRLRELRVLGWMIKTSKVREGTGRVRAYYELVEPPPPWPDDGNIRAEIRRRERLRGY